MNYDSEEEQIFAAWARARQWPSDTKVQSSDTKVQPNKARS